MKILIKIDNPNKIKQSSSQPSAPKVQEFGASSKPVSNQPVFEYNQPTTSSSNRTQQQTQQPQTSQLDFRERDGQNLDACEAMEYIRGQQQDASTTDSLYAKKNLAINSSTSGDGSREAQALIDAFNGGCQTITMDTNGDGVMEEVSIAEAIEKSSDSVLDLYAKYVYDQAIERFGTKFYWGGSFNSPEAKAFFEEHGIQVSQLSNRTYVFSVVDSDGNLLEDENGNTGEYIFSDCLIPDGYAQGAESNMYSLLDVMGKDILSQADFIGHEDEYLQLMAEVGADIQSGNYQSSGKKTQDIFGEAKSSWRNAAPSSGANGESLLSEEQLEELQEKNKDSLNEAIILAEYNQKVEANKKEAEEEFGEPVGTSTLTSIENEVKLEMVKKYGAEVREIIK